jgi:hypothetical protein
VTLLHSLASILTMENPALTGIAMTVARSALWGHWVSDEVDVSEGLL